MAPPELLEEAQAAVSKQGDAVRALKAAKAPKEEVDAAVALLKKLKEQAAAAAASDSSIEASAPAGDDGNANASKARAAAAKKKKSIRETVMNVLERRMIVVPSFSIYGGVAGLYDYGPPGCALKANVLNFWREHFVAHDDLLEVDCPCLTPEAVLKASGHVDKFTDLMVKDLKDGTCHRADHLVKDFVQAALEKGSRLSADIVEDYKKTLASLDDWSSEQLGAKIKEYGIKAPETKNDLSDPFPFNLMFATQIGPTGTLLGYLRPETAQGMFVNFKDLLYYNGGRLPFGAAQIGQAFRNEIAPRQGLLRVREFTLAEIEFFVDPTDKSHPGFESVADLEFLLYPRHEQMELKDPVKLRLRDAVKKGTINNETLGYYIGRTYLFLTTVGINKDRLRFRQHLANEMAHYAADCWDAELECSFGWIECVGLADRSAYDLKAHAEASKVELSAQRNVSSGEVNKKESFVPSVIEPSFGIGRIIYCLFEHCFDTRVGKGKDEQCNVFSFPPLVAPIKCTVFPLLQRKELDDKAKVISAALKKAGIVNKIDTTGRSIGKRYARTDEIGVPFAITVDFEEGVTVRDRDSREQIRVPVDEVTRLVADLTHGKLAWQDAQAKYPAVAAKN